MRKPTQSLKINKTGEAGTPGGQHTRARPITTKADMRIVQNCLTQVQSKFNQSQKALEKVTFIYKTDH
jgi:hypothetical protein